MEIFSQSLTVPTCTEGMKSQLKSDMYLAVGMYITIIESQFWVVLSQCVLV